MENLSRQEIDYAIAKDRVKQLKRFYVSLVIFILIFTIYGLWKYNKTGEIIYLNLSDISAVFWIWAVVLGVKAVKIFFFNHTWERKMIDKELNQR